MFLPPDHEIHCIQNRFVKNIVLSNIIRVLFCAFPRAHLGIKKFKLLLCTSVYHISNPSVREFGDQDTIPRFTRLIPGNVCVQDEDIW